MLYLSNPLLLEDVGGSMFERLDIDTPIVPNSFESYRAGLGSPPNKHARYAVNNPPEEKNDQTSFSLVGDMMWLFYTVLPFEACVRVSIYRGVFPVDRC